MGETINWANRERQLTIADAWRAAVADAALPLPADELRQRFDQLVAGALEALEPWVTAEAALDGGRAIGGELAALANGQAALLETSLAVLSAQLAGAAAPALLGMLCLLYTSRCV